MVKLLYNLSLINLIYDYAKVVVMGFKKKLFGIYSNTGEVIIPCNLVKAIENDGSNASWNDYPMIYYAANGDKYGLTTTLPITAVKLK